MMNTDAAKAAEAALLELGFGDNANVSTDSLADLAGIASMITLAIGHHVKVLRNCDLSWEQIGSALGVSRQAAQQRYGV